MLWEIIAGIFLKFVDLEKTRLALIKSQSSPRPNSPLLHSFTGHLYMPYFSHEYHTLFPEKMSENALYQNVK